MRVCLSGGSTYYPITFGHTFAYTTAMMDPQVEVMVEQNKLITSLAAKGDCVIVGRCADLILEGEHPFNSFVYADAESKFAWGRSRRREDEESLSDNELRRRRGGICASWWIA